MENISYPQKLTTERLSLELLTEGDSSFIFALVNTEGWLRFIGNRNVDSALDAIAYIQKIKANPAVIYWMVKLKDTNQTIGIITFIKRDYLAHHDIGFAFLPDFAGKGYAIEAAQSVLNFLIHHNDFSRILATTLPENVSSINLLQKLGFEFDKAIEIDHKTLHIYQSKLHQQL